PAPRMAYWAPLQLNTEDGGVLRAARVRVNGDIIAVQGAADSGHDVAMFQLHDCASALAADIVHGFDVCSICGGDTLVDFGPEANAATGVTAYCQAADGSGYAAVKRVAVGPVAQPCAKVLSNPAVATSFFDESSALISRQAPGIAAFAGSHGNL